MKITRLYPDDQGETHFEEVEIPLERAGEIGALSAVMPATGIAFRYTDETYNYDWHNAPARQYVIMLDGAVDITVSDGETRRFGGGEVLLVEDTWGKGHISRAVEGQPRRSIFVILD